MFVKTLKIPFTIHEHSRLTAGLQRKAEEAIFFNYFLPLSPTLQTLRY